MTWADWAIFAVTGAVVTVALDAMRRKPPREIALHVISWEVGVLIAAAVVALLSAR